MSDTEKVTPAPKKQETAVITAIRPVTPKVQQASRISFSARQLTWLKENDKSTFDALNKAYAHVVKAVPTAAAGKPSDPKVAKELRAIRASLGLTQAQMAEAVKVERRRYSWMEYEKWPGQVPAEVMKLARSLKPGSQAVRIIKKRA